MPLSPTRARRSADGMRSSGEDIVGVVGDEKRKARAELVRWVAMRESPLAQAG